LVAIQNHQKVYTLWRNAVIENLEIIEEAIKNISDNTRKDHSESPWKQIAELRGTLLHHYF